MTPIKNQLLRYWLALNASAFDAAVHASAAFFGVAGIHCAIDTVPALNFKQLGAVFAISFLRGALKYLDAHPLADVAQAFQPAGSRDIPVPCSSLATVAPELATGKSPEPAGSKACATSQTPASAGTGRLLSSDGSDNNPAIH
jgi:hypothetical protein